MDKNPNQRVANSVFFFFPTISSTRKDRKGRNCREKLNSYHFGLGKLRQNCSKIWRAKGNNFFLGPVDMAAEFAYTPEKK